MITSALSPLSITLGSPDVVAYKTIDTVEWRDIPGFAVLTGLNGSGKTQFLQVLAHRLTRTPHYENPDLRNFPLVVEGSAIDPNDVAYLPNATNAFRVQGTSIAEFQNVKQNFISRIANPGNDIETSILRARVQREFGFVPNSQPNVEQLSKLPDNFSFLIEHSDVSAGLSHFFFGYQVRMAEAMLAGASKEEAARSLGPPPWTILNEALATAGFLYRVVAPEPKLLSSYMLRITRTGGGKEMDLNDLSSGEKTILRTLLWLYNSRHNGQYPKLFLLDEPDAHLHPSMTYQFIDILKNVLVDQYGVRVILTTHSPSTVALAPEDSIFVMSRDQPRISRPSSKQAAIGLLTAGLVVVSNGTRFAVVEDDADKKFYDALRDVLTDQGPNKDANALKSAPSIVFMPASIGGGREKTSGGLSIVHKWINKFDEPPLSQLFCGLVDNDGANQASERIFVIERYSIENYQLDPPIVFGLLIEEGTAPRLPGVGITKGDEHLIRTLNESALQSIVDYIAGEVGRLIGPLSPVEEERSVVEFTNGVKAQYPNWMLTRRGHDLLPKYQEAFNQKVITPPKLEKSFRRIRLVPKELATLLHRIQAS